MENPTSILLYSKYSSNCQEISNLINGSPVPLPFKFLCTDNKEVRQRITDNKKIDVNYVPCILNVYPNGAVEQYEGPKAFDVVKSILSSIPPPIPPANQIPAQQQQEVYEPDPPPAPKQRNVKRRPPPMKRPDTRKESQNTGATRIDDLPEDYDYDEYEEMEEMEEMEESKPSREPIRKPVRRVRTNKGNFVEHEGEEYNPPEHTMTGHREIRESTDRNIKDDQSNISMKAQELAKEREQADNQFKPRGAAIPTEMRRE